MTDELARFSEAEAKIALTTDVPTLYEYYGAAKAYEEYSRAMRLKQDQVARAVFVRLQAARRIGELVPAKSPQETGRGKLSENRIDILPAPQRIPSACCHS